MKKPFSTLTAAEKRVAIAKDVIAQIKAEKYISIVGYILVFGGLAIKQRELNQNPTCGVCAAGAAALSAIRLGNHFEFEGSVLSRNPTFKILERWFSFKQAKMIEAAYEGYSEQGLKCERFAPEIEWGTKRIVAIMENIIKNRGTFKP